VGGQAQGLDSRLRLLPVPLCEMGGVINSTA
jgi:hypothetical protein